VRNTFSRFYFRHAKNNAKTAPIPDLTEL